MATYDNLAKYYDGFLFIGPWLSVYHKQAIKFLLPFIKDNDVVLDAGCGTASFLKKLYKQNKTLKISGFDESPSMIKRAKKKKIPNAEFYIDNVRSLSLHGEYFNIITCIDSFYYFDQPEFLAICKKALKPGGFLFIDTLSVDHYKLVVKPWIWIFKMFSFGQNTKHLKLEQILSLAQANGLMLEAKKVLPFPLAPFCRRWLLVFKKQDNA